MVVLAAYSELMDMLLACSACFPAVCLSLHMLPVGSICVVDGAA